MHRPLGDSQCLKYRQDVNKQKLIGLYCEEETVETATLNFRYAELTPSPEHLALKGLINDTLN